MPDDYESIWLKIIFQWTPSPWLYFIVPLNLQLDLKRNKLWEAIWPCAPTQWISLHQPLSIMLMFLLYLNFNLVLVDVQFSIMLIYANTFPWTWSFITGIRMSRDSTCFKTASSSLSRSCPSSRSSSPSENKGWGLTWELLRTENCLLLIELCYTTPTPSPSPSSSSSSPSSL